MPKHKRSEYNQEQLDTLQMVRTRLQGMSQAQRQRLRKKMTDYLAFRSEVDAFLREHFSTLCSRTCYTSQLSACCAKEGIITFFADVVINALQSTGEQLEQLEQNVKRDRNQDKCVYLGPGGCRWRVRPIVCAMFLCDRAARAVLGKRPELKSRWDELCRRRQLFTWPDRPVLFDELETTFIALGCDSPLMYLHNSPGLLRLKQNKQNKGVRSQRAVAQSPPEE